MARLRLALVLAGMLVAATASAETVLLRMAAIAPDGSWWPQELRAFSREVTKKTEGRVRFKWYFSAIAGDEVTVLERIRKDQLDGQAAAQVCDRLAPTLRVTRMLGLFQNRDEYNHILGVLRSRLDGEFRESGFVGFVSGVGNDILFTRRPVRSLAEMKQLRPWLWNEDEVMAPQLRALGVTPLLLPVEQAGHAWDRQQIDSFIAIPTAALAFQWSSRARYFTNLPFGFVPGCLVVTNRVFDTLSLPDQQTLREAAAKLAQRIDELGGSQDALLLGGLFARQGLQAIPPSDRFRADFFAAAPAAREPATPKLIPRDLVLLVMGKLADFRAEHPH
jgi:TRAP-type C4-dicarboxylate transport system substrate-binding protein